MQDLTTHPVGVDRGSVLIFSDFEEGGPMWTSDGPRLVRRHVRFAEPFRSPPEILVTLEMWDFDTQTNIRGDLSSEDVNATGFDIVFKTWGDTRVARIRAGWLALGTRAHADDWSVQ